MATRGRSRLRNLARSGRNARGRKTSGSFVGAAKVARRAGIKSAAGVRGGNKRYKAGTTYKRGGKSYMYVPTGAGRSTMAVQTRGRRSARGAGAVARKGGGRSRVKAA